MLWSVIVLAASAVITALATIFSAWLARSSPPPRLGALSRHLVEPIRQRGECGGVASRRIMADTAASRWIQPDRGLGFAVAESVVTAPSSRPTVLPTISAPLFQNPAERHEAFVAGSMASAVSLASRQASCSRFSQSLRSRNM
jgi:hypothetical protein